MPNAVAQNRNDERRGRRDRRGRARAASPSRNARHGDAPERAGGLLGARVELLPEPADRAHHDGVVEEHERGDDRGERAVQAAGTRAARRSTSSDRNATPTTTVGSTNGTVTNARSSAAPAERAPVQHVRAGHAEQHRERPSPSAGLRERQPDDPPGARAGEHVGEPAEVERAVGDEPARRPASTTGHAKNTPEERQRHARPRAPRTRRRATDPTPPQGDGGSGGRRDGHAVSRSPCPSSAVSHASRFAAMSAGSTSNGSVGERRELPPTPRAASTVGLTGYMYMDSGMSAWTSSESRKSSSCCGALGVLRAREHAGVLDLPEARVEQRAGGRRRRRPRAPSYGGDDA